MDDPAYTAEQICIELYLQPWLELTGARLSERVETIEKEVFSWLQRNDLLFIDSSHIVRPQGDVSFVYLEILPILNPGLLFTYMTYSLRKIISPGGS
jgi:hypothetical protein